MYKVQQINTYGIPLLCKSRHHAGLRCADPSVKIKLIGMIWDEEGKIQEAKGDKV